MSDANSVTKSLLERFGGGTEDRLGRALSDLLENPLLTGALGRAFDAREKAAQAQEVAMGALNLPSAADIERLTRRLRSVSYRLEGIEDGVARLDRSLAHGGVEARLSAVEERLQTLTLKLDERAAPQRGPASTEHHAGTRATPASRARGSAKAAGKAGARASAPKARRTAKAGGGGRKAGASRKAPAKGA